MYKQYKIVVLCISRVSDTRHFEFINEFNKHINAYGYKLFIYQTCSDLYWDNRSENGEKRVFDLIDYDIADVIIVWDEAFADKSVPEDICMKARKNNVPVISVGASREGCCNINFEYVSGFEKIVRHVVEYHGISDLFLLGGLKGNDFSEARIDVFKKVLKENGIECTEDMIGYGDFWDGPTRTVIEDLINRRRVPKAIICINDMMAVTTCSVLQENGYVIPYDVMVTGFDGMEEAALCSPTITTCRCDFNKMSDMIMGFIASGLERENIAGEFKIPFTPDIGNSCGCKKNKPSINTGQMLKQHNDRLRLFAENEHLMYEMSMEAVTCENSREFVEYLNDFGLKDMSIVVNTECMDSSVNPVQPVRDGFGNDMYEIYADGISVDGLPALINRKDMFINMDEILAKNRPVIFSAVTYMGIPIGYNVFFFEVNMNNYYRVTQFVTLVNTIISGYRNMRYLQYTLKAMENMYKYDHLTGLYNRHAFYNELHNIIEETGHGQYIVVTIDLDGLKYINDTYGHNEGDFAISTVAYAIKSLPIREKLYGRFGGDEMVMCIKTADADADTELLRGGINRYLEYVNRTSGKPYKVSVSMGIAVCDEKGFDFDIALKKSDKLMYIEKTGKNAERTD